VVHFKPEFRVAASYPIVVSPEVMVYWLGLVRRNRCYLLGVRAVTDIDKDGHSDGEQILVGLQNDTASGFDEGVVVARKGPSGCAIFLQGILLALGVSVFVTLRTMRDRGRQSVDGIETYTLNGGDLLLFLVSSVVVLIIYFLLGYRILHLFLRKRWVIWIVALAGTAIFFVLGLAPVWP
jgi:hypothetical protein